MIESPGENSSILVLGSFLLNLELGSLLLNLELGSFCRLNAETWPS